MNLFDFDKLLNENCSYTNCMEATHSDEVYLHTVLKKLESMNESVTSSMKTLTVSVLEAESRKEENCYFCKAFEEFKNTIVKFITDINVIVGKFSIEMDTIADSANDLITDDEYIDNYADDLTDYKITRYTHLSDNFPNIDPILIYKNEFDKIGKLMQNIGNVAPNDAKLQIIASVYNEFSKDLSTNWNDAFIKSIFGNASNSDNYAEMLYSSFRGSSMVCSVVNKSEIYNAKNVVMNYKFRLDAAIDGINKTLEKFEEIALDVESMIFRNEDHTLKIDTPTDGVENRNYQLDEYSINQFNIFMKAKISQITQLCNLYSIAIAIKLDAIKESLIKSKNLLQDAKNAYDCNKSIGSIEDKFDDFYDNDDKKFSDFKIAIDEDPDDGEDHYYDRPEPEVRTVVHSDDSSNDIIDGDDEDLEEAYLLDYHLFTLDRILESEDIISTIKESVLMEDGENNSGDNGSNNEPPALNANLTSQSGVDIINFMIAQIQKLWNAFNEKFVQQTDRKNKALQKNKNYIIGSGCRFKSMKDIADLQVREGGDPDGQFTTIKHVNPVYDSKSSKYLTLRNFDVTVNNYGDQKIIDTYSDEISYMKFLGFSESEIKYLQENTGDNISKWFEYGFISGDNVSWNKCDHTNWDIPQMYKWCTADYQNVYKRLNTMYNQLMQLKGKLSVVARNFEKNSKNGNNNQDTNSNNSQNNNGQNQNNNNQNSNQNSGGKSNFKLQQQPELKLQQSQESALLNTLDYYFGVNEASSGIVPTSVKNNSNNSASNFKKMLKVYISANTKILSGHMSGVHKVYNEFFQLLNLASKFNGRPVNQNNDQNQNNDAGNDQNQQQQPQQTDNN